MNKLKDDRNWLVVMFLTLITCGIYGIYFAWVQIRDTNIACAQDGKKTAGLIKLIILTLLTFGIYAVIWDIKLVCRWQNFAESNGEKAKYSLIIHVLFSYVLSAAGIFAIIASFLRLSAFNQVCRLYNGNNGLGGSASGKKSNTNKEPNPADNLWGWKDASSKWERTQSKDKK